MKTNALLFSLILATAAAEGQSNCYEKIRSDGLALARQKRYGEAINQFWTALATCDDLPKNHDLDERIKKATEDWVKELDDKARREAEAAEAARLSQKKAETAEAGARESQLLAEKKGAEARREARRAEALRLSLLSNSLRQKGKKSDALLVSLIACRLAGPALDSLPGLRRAFAEAVRDSMSAPVFSGGSPLRSVRWLDGSRALAQLADGSAHLLFFEKKNDGSAAARSKLLAPPSAPAAGLAFSEKGGGILVWPPDGPPQLFDGEGRLLARLPGHSEAVRCAAFSPDGKLVATGSRDNTARLWSAIDGAPVAVLSGHTGNVYEVRFSPDGDGLVTRSSDGTARLWGSAGEPRGAIGKGSGYVNGIGMATGGGPLLATAASGLMAFGPGGGAAIFSEAGKTAVSTTFFGKKILASDGLGNHELLDAAGRPLARLDAPSVAPSPNGSLLAGWGGAGNGVKFWDGGGRPIGQFFLEGKKPRTLDWHPGGQLLLLTMADGSAHLTDRSGNTLTEWPADWAGYTAAATFSLDGKAVLVAGARGLSLTLSPEPGGVFERLSAVFDPSSEAVRQVAARHGVRGFFFGE